MKKTRFAIAIVMSLMLIVTLIPVSASAASLINISKAKITLSYSSCNYSGAAKKPTVKVVYGSKTLKNGTDYAVGYRNNVKPGKASVKIAGRGKYKGSVTKYFTINEVYNIVQGTSLVTKDYTFIGKATDTFKWTYKASNKQITSLSCTQTCSGIKQISTLQKISKKCTSKTSTTQYWTTVYGLYLPQPIKALGKWKFAQITSKYKITGNTLTTVSRKWKWSLTENW